MRARDNGLDLSLLLGGQRQAFREPFHHSVVMGSRANLTFRADVFNVLNNQNLLAGGYVNFVGDARFGQHNGGSNVLPGRQFQFALTYRF